MMTSLVYEVAICIEPHVDVSLCVLNYLKSDIYPRRSSAFFGIFVALRSRAAISVNTPRCRSSSSPSSAFWK